MKKLMMAAAIVCAAAVSQAASVSWNSGDFTVLTSCAPGYTDYGVTGTGDLDTGCIKAMVWESLTAFSYTTAEEVYNAYKAGELDAANAKVGYSDGFEGYVNVEGAKSYAEGNKVYAAILYLHEDNIDFDNADFYMANLASANATDAGGQVGDLGNTFGGVGGTSASGAATVWTETAAIPEPTSGLLLLLGMAGLALRRRA